MAKKSTAKIIKHAAIPLLFSIYPIIFLYAYNIEMLSIRQLFLPLLFAIVLALAAFLPASLILRSTVKGSMVAALFLLLFWNYDLLFQAIRLSGQIRERYILIILVVFFALLMLAVVVTKKKSKLDVISTVLLVVAAFLVIINLFTIIPGELQKAAAGADSAAFQSNHDRSDQFTGGPDLYLLIFDEYARLDTIEEEWVYDNSELAEFLQHEGFYLAEESMVKHPGTVETMPELLNIDYFASGKKEAELVALYYNNLLFAFFNEIGYEVIFLDGYNHPLRRNVPAYVSPVTYADLYRDEESILNDSFKALLFSRTLLRPFEHRLGVDQRGTLFYEGNKGFFELLKNELPLEKRPKFIFAHINSPHLPYVFDRDGTFSDNKTHFYEHDHYSAEELKAMYLEQYIYITKVMKEIVEAIKTKNDREAIILIQADHGPRPSSAGNSSMSQAYKVFNAVYFPDGDYSRLSEDISPVNTMRVVLNQYFGEDLPMLQ